MTERIAIVGTAQSWVKTPWNDPGLTILSLNDAYRIAGFQRADGWYDFHPIHEMYFAPPGTKQVYAHEVPVGAYVRPHEHLDWIAKLDIPVWLNPEWQTQRPSQDFAQGWYDALRAKPNVQAFPKAEIESHFGTYHMSSPAWMIAHAILQGAKEIHIYGIHLATQQEYIDQRPQFEFLLGTVLGSGKRTLTINDGMRCYETANGRVLLPVESPVLQSDFQYGFERRPTAALEPLKWKMHVAQQKRQRVIDQLKVQKPWQFRSTSALQQELWQLDAVVADVQDAMSRVELARMVG